jgi:hypothetical protein
MTFEEDSDRTPNGMGLLPASRKAFSVVFERLAALERVFNPTYEPDPLPPRTVSASPAVRSENNAERIDAIEQVLKGYGLLP